MKGLFKLSKDVIIQGVKFKEIELDDKDFINSYIMMSEYPLTQWHSYFTYLWSYGQGNTRKVLYTLVDGLLVTIVRNNKGICHMMTLPFGKGDKETVVKVTRDVLELLNAENSKIDDKKKANVHYVLDNQLEFLLGAGFKDNSEDFKFKKASEGLEYQYSIPGLIKLEGKDFAYIRRKLNKFHKNYPNAVIKEYESYNWDDMLLLQKLWNENEGDKYFRIFDATYYRATVKECKRLGHSVLLVEIDGNIAGMISGEILPNGEGICYLRKPLSKYEGLSEFLIVELAKHLHEKNNNALVLTDGGGGTPLSNGLNYFKQKFRPVASPQVWVMELA